MGLVQPNGFAFSFQFARYRSMPRSSDRTLEKLPRRIVWSVTRANQGSTRLSQEALVTVKWTWKRGCSLNHARALRPQGA